MTHSLSSIEMSSIEDAPPARGRLMRLIVNGRAAIDPALRAAVQVLREQGHHVEVRVTWEESDAAIFAAEAALAGFESIMAIGGDGTLNGVINGIMKSRLEKMCAVGVVPYGTGNDFATMAGIPTNDPSEALALAVNGEPVMIDVGRMNDQMFINIATGGFGAEVTSNTPPEMKSFLGSLAYPLFGLANMASIAARTTRVSAPDFDWEGPAYLIAVGNGRMAGGGFDLCPQALLDDGLLDLVIVPELSFLQLVTIVNDLMRSGRHLSTENVIHRKVPWVELFASEGIQINLDGEPHFGEHFRFDIPAQIPIYLPAAAPLRRDRNAH